MKMIKKMLIYNKTKTIGNYLLDLLQGIKTPVIFELGMHFGEDTARIMNCCESVPNYHGFEPDPRNIKKIISKNFQYKIKLNKSAIGNKIGIIDFYLSEGKHPTNGNLMTGANSIRTPNQVLKRHNWIKFNKKIKVKCTNLNDYCKKNNIHYIDFIWCDIQGAEYDMLLGASKILSQTKYMLLEYSDIELYKGQKTINEYLKLLSKFGDWEIVHKFKIDVLLQNKSLLK